ncbi:hypothetical protein [Terrabacter terrigena]|uniref:DUF3515 domain-containing protein n=1 Tax=Terrabacter terrigena TaxID=574718 RepID=A0ABW3MUR6_9MICO
MSARRPLPYAVRRTLAAVALAPVVALALAACGSTTYDAPGAEPTAAVRPLTTQPVAPDGALACPVSLEDAAGTTVPEKPQGVDGAARLLPERAPVSLVVCGYPVMDITATTPLVAPFPLRTRTVATGAQRTAVVEAMTWAPRSALRPRPCTDMAGNETAYLVGAAYGDAIVWVAAKADANACSTATNGDFVSGAPLGVVLHETVGARTRPTVAEEPCRVRSWGRLGDDRLLAPEGGPTVVVCRPAVDGSARATALDAARSAEVVAALGALSTRPTGRTCDGSGKASDPRFSLVLRYATGPSVRVDVDPGCDPAVLGTNLESREASTLVALVERWSPPIPGPDPNGSVSSDGSVGPPPLPVPAPDQPTEVPGSPGGGFQGSTGAQPTPPEALPTDVPMTR